MPNYIKYRIMIKYLLDILPHKQSMVILNQYNTIIYTVWTVELDGQDV